MTLRVDRTTLIITHAQQRGNDRFLSLPGMFQHVNVIVLHNQSINLYRAIVQRRLLQCGYAESKRNVLRRILNVLTDGAVRHFSGREFQSFGTATEKRRAAVVRRN